MTTPVLTIVNPKFGARHTHTIVLLHGRGSNGLEFKQEILDDNDTAQTLEHWRWVFPTSPVEWSDQFKEDMNMWFVADSLSDPTLEQRSQIPGLHNSIDQIIKIVRHEVELLDGHAERLVIGGISQGMATALWTMIHLSTELRGIGGFVGISGWLPFAAQVAAVASSTPLGKLPDIAPWPSSLDEIRDFVAGTSVLFGHGEDDGVIDVALGREARDALIKLGMSVTWCEYKGAEQEGHSLKEPEELDDIVEFLKFIERGTGSVIAVHRSLSHLRREYKGSSSASKARENASIKENAATPR